MCVRRQDGWRCQLLKSRARIKRTLRNELADSPEGAASYEPELPEGGDTLVLCNRVEQSAQPQNTAMISTGIEEAQGAEQGNCWGTTCPSTTVRARRQRPCASSTCGPRACSGRWACRRRAQSSTARA